MTTLLDLITLAKNRIDEVDTDTQIDNIIQEGINFAYMFKTAKLEPQFTSVTLAVTDGMITLPSDLMSIESISPALSETDYKKGQTLFVNAVDTTEYTIIYKQQRTALTTTSSVVTASDKLKYALVTYGCYAYQQYRKRQPMANVYLQEFQSIMQEMEFDSISNDEKEDLTEVKDAIFGTVTNDDTVIGEW